VAYQSNKPALSLLHPVLVLFLAAAWAHDEYRVRQKSLYIRKRIEARLGQDSEQRWWLGWEHYLKRTRSQRGYHSLGQIAARGVFITSSVVAILIGCTPLLTDADILQALQQGVSYVFGATLPATWIVYLCAVLAAAVVTMAPTLAVLIFGAKRGIPAPEPHDSPPTEEDQ
jgi:hypothetical protein